MATKNLFVGKLPYSLKLEEVKEKLTELFSTEGTIVSINIIPFREEGMEGNGEKHKGYGFVEMETEEQAEAVMNKYNGYTLDNMQIYVKEAIPREERPARRPGGYGDRKSFGGGNRRSGGGYGGGERSYNNSDTYADAA